MKEFCVDLEIAKELKENGYPQETSFLVLALKGHPTYDFSSKNGGKGTFDVIYDPKLRDEYLSAPCSDEILKELPNEINGYVLEIIRYENGTIEADFSKSFWADDETEYLIKSKKLFYKLSMCLAELWLDLKKEGYIK